MSKVIAEGHHKNTEEFKIAMLFSFYRKVNSPSLLFAVQLDPCQKRVLISLLVGGIYCD